VIRLTPHYNYSLFIILGTSPQYYKKLKFPPINHSITPHPITHIVVQITEEILYLNKRMGIKHLKTLMGHIQDEQQSKLHTENPYDNRRRHDSTAAIMQFDTFDSYVFYLKKGMGRNPTKLIIMIDTMGYCYRYGIDFNIIDGFIQQLWNFISRDVVPVYIFDGRASPIEKAPVVKFRQQRKQRKENEFVALIRSHVLNLSLKSLSPIVTRVRENIHALCFDEAFIALMRSNFNDGNTHSSAATHIIHIVETNIPFIEKIIDEITDTDSYLHLDAAPEDLNSIWDSGTSTNTSDEEPSDTTYSGDSDYTDSTGSNSSNVSMGSMGHDTDAEIEVEVEIDDTNIDDDSKMRQLSRQSFSIKHEDIQLIKSLFSILGIPFHTAPGEADSLCAYFYKKYPDQIHGFLTIDMDSLPRGCNQIINITKGMVTCYDLKNILRMMKFDTLDQFVELCILLGCDFEKCVPRIKAEELYRRYIQCGSMDAFIHEFASQDPGIVRYLPKYHEVKRIFLQPDDTPFDTIQFNPVIPGGIDMNDLKKFTRQCQLQGKISDRSLKLLHKIAKKIGRK
jgi:hypothetical protein